MYVYPYAIVRDDTENLMAQKRPLHSLPICSWTENSIGETKDAHGFIVKQLF